MSLQETKEQMLQLLRDTENRVIALSGKWGTGKTHLLSEITKSSGEESIKGALYVSLFGLSTIDQVKGKLIETVALGAEANAKILDGAKQALKAGIKALEGFHKGFSALNDLNLLLLAPTMLKGKVIVLDDIERKHEKLGIDEILGFIDEFTQRHSARFVLVLNSDQLAKREIWETFREKVIDQEIRLLTTPAEAVSIAVGITASRYAASIERAAITCGLTNIRIIRKIIRATNRILGDHDLEQALLMRVVPSIVLFSAIHYKGLEDGPDVHFALNVGAPDEWGDLAKGDNEAMDDEEKKRARWRLMMKELGIAGCDEFEVLLVEFLESGLFDKTKLTPIIERYIAEKNNFEALERARQVLDQIEWDYRLSESDLVNRAKELVPNAGLLDPYVASELDRELAQLNGGKDVGAAIVAAWISAFKGRKHDEVDDDNTFGRYIHPQIAAEITAMKNTIHSGMSVLDACLHIIENSGWGTRHEIALRRATADDFEAEIRKMDPALLGRFLRRMLQMRLQKERYDEHFGTATEHFVEACRKIANDPTSERLGSIVTRVFESVRLAANLKPPQEDPPAMPEDGVPPTP